MQKNVRSRTVSAPPALRLQCGSVSRERQRESDAWYETGRDRAALSISQWSHDEVRAVLYHLICRCSQPQLKALHTALESVPHRDLQLSTVGVVSGLELRPISTPQSREIRIRLRKSRRPQNRRLFRAQSAVLHEELPLRPSPLPPPSAHHTQIPSLRLTLPTLSPSTLHHSLWLPVNSSSPPQHQSRISTHLTTSTLHLSPSLPHTTGRCSTVPARSMTSFGFRALTTPRRHMLTTPTTPPRQPMTSDLQQLPVNATQFLTWFSSLTPGWQQQELLQMIVMNLDPSLIYYLAALLMSRQFRDPVSCLPVPLALHMLSFLPAKDLLRNCTTVSRVWQKRCTSEILWKTLCSLTKLGVPFGREVSWRRLFMDNLRMKHNWWRGQCDTRTLAGHTGRVLCVKLRNDIVATGSSDCTIRIWSMESAKCLKVLTGHTRGVWSLCFYGKRLLISGSSDGSVKVWNIETGVCERSVEAHSGTVWCLQHKREVLVTGSHDKTAMVWKMRSLEPSQPLLGHGGVVMAVDLTDSATTALTGAGDGVVRVWEVCSGECVRVVGEKGGPPITSLSWSKGWLAVSGGCTVSIYETGNWKSIYELTGHEDRVECVQLKVHTAGSGRGLVITASRDGTVRYWSSHTGRLIATLTGHTATVNAVASNSWAIVSASNDLTIKIWNFHSYTHPT